MTDVKTLLAWDTAARERIDRDIDTNFFVEASAGSGKTSKLVDRLFAMVLHGRGVEQICAITFTKNAAGEFYRRFEQRLRNELTNEMRPEEEKERIRSALRDIDLCFMGTIDAFCQMILAEHPAEAGIPSDATIVSESELKRFASAELSRIRAEDVSSELSKLLGVLRTAVPGADDLIADNFPAFLKRRSGTLVYERPNEKDADVDRLFAGEIDAVRRLLLALAAHPELVIRDGDKASRKAAETLPAALPLLQKPWNDQIGEVKTVLNRLSALRLYAPPDGLPEEWSGLVTEHTGKKKYFELTLANPGHVLDTLGELQYSLFMQFMEKFSALAGAKAAKAGLLRFSDCQLLLRDLLKKSAGSDGELIRHIMARHSTFLIDEFQDTDPMQIEIFFYLTGTNLQEDWTKCCPAPGSLFLVGDPKQSIYRFRQSDIRAYQRVKNLFVPPVGEVLYLYRNFRSTSAMHHKFNDMFRTILPEEDTPDQSRFEDIPSPEHREREGTTGVYTYAGSRNTREDACAVADCLLSLAGNPAVTLAVREGEQTLFRPVDWKDIMVVTRDKKSLGVYMDKCMENGIPVRVEGKTIFSRCPALEELSRILPALVSPEDSLCVYRALSGRVFHISDNELMEYVQQGGTLRLSDREEQTSSGHRVDTAKKILAPLVKEGKNGGIALLFDKVLEQLPVLQCCGTDHLEYLTFAKELVRAKESEGAFTGSREAAEYLQALRADADTDIERSLQFSPEENRVHFANLHKIKGLEAPVVILADPALRRETDPHQSSMLSGSCQQHCVFTVSKGYIPVLSTKRLEERKEKEKELCRQEGDRLLYVAATRAGNLLIVADPGDEKASAWSKLLPFAQGDIGEVTGDSRAEQMEKETFSIAQMLEKGRREQKKPEACLEPGTIVSRPSAAAAEAYEKDCPKESPDNPSGDQNREVSLFLGTAVHRLMERLVRSRGAFSPEELAESVAQELDPPEGLALQRVMTVLHSVAQTMKNGGYEQETGIPKDLLKELQDADEICCELPFCTKEGREMTLGVMDLAYRKGNAWHVIDYKTNERTDGLREHYAPQLEAYARTLSAAGCPCVSSDIYHIELPGNLG